MLSRPVWTGPKCPRNTPQNGCLRQGLAQPIGLALLCASWSVQDFYCSKGGHKIMNPPPPIVEMCFILKLQKYLKFSKLASPTGCRKQSNLRFGPKIPGYFAVAIAMQYAVGVMHQWGEGLWHFPWGGGKLKSKALSSLNHGLFQQYDFAAYSKAAKQQSRLSDPSRRPSLW